MKRFLINKPAVKQSLLFTIVVSLSIWVGSNPISLQHEKSSVPVTTSTTILNNLSQQIQPQVYWLRSNSNHPLGGEGLILQQPTTRAQFAADFL